MSIETNNFKKSCFHDDKSFWPIFPPHIACQKPQRKTFGGPQANMIITVEPVKAFLGPKRLLEKQSFEKKCSLSSEEKILD